MCQVYYCPSERHFPSAARGLISLPRLCGWGQWTYFPPPLVRGRAGWGQLPNLERRDRCRRVRAPGGGEGRLIGGEASPQLMDGRHLIPGVWRRVEVLRPGAGWRDRRVVTGIGVDGHNQLVDLRGGPGRAGAVAGAAHLDLGCRLVDGVGQGDATELPDPDRSRALRTDVDRHVGDPGGDVRGEPDLGVLRIWRGDCLPHG